MWRGATGNVDAAVAAARKAWPAWGAAPLGDRIEKLRSFANRARAELETFADLIARETGKPLWEAKTEVESVINKVDISVKAYADRTSQRRFEGKPGTRSALRHKPHGVLAVLGDKVVGASSIEGAVRESDLLIVATGWPEYKEIDPAWCKRTNGQRLTVLDLWRTLPADKFADVADVLYLGSGR